MPEAWRVLPAMLRHSAGQHGDKLRFLVVGSIGFMVDGGMMMLLEAQVGWSPLLARMLSFPLAVTVTWLLNRIWTFKRRTQRAAAGQYALYFLIQLGGLAINFSVFALLISSVAWFADHSIVALALGSVLAMVFTFACSTRFVFSAEPQR